MRLRAAHQRERDRVLEARELRERADREARRTVLDAVKAGLPHSVAAEALGVSRMTMHRWLSADVKAAQTPTTEEESSVSIEKDNPLDKQTAHSKAEAYVVVAQLNYRAGVTRHGPPVISKIRELHGEISADRAKFIKDQTDRRIRQAAARSLSGEW